MEYPHTDVRAPCTRTEMSADSAKEAQAARKITAISLNLVFPDIVNGHSSSETPPGKCYAAHRYTMLRIAFHQISENRTYCFLCSTFALLSR